MLLHSAKINRHLKFLGHYPKNPWSFLLHSSFSDALPKKPKLAPLQERRMIDRFKLYTKGGDGGSGCSSIHRSMKDRRGKPDGGNGGRGGDVILECSPAVWDFSGLQHHVTAGRGGHGTSKNKIGTRGSDKVIQVPVGTVIHLVRGEIPCVTVEECSSEDLDPWEIPGTLTDEKTELIEPDKTSSSSIFGEGRTKNLTVMDTCMEVESTDSFSQTSASEYCSKEETDEEPEMKCNVAELIKQGERVLIACGGEGGFGSVSMSKLPKKPRLTSPRANGDNTIEVEKSDGDQSSIRAGLPGSEAVIVLELKSIADVSFVGMPNVGKSTLLGAISRAKPCVGDYDFTTLRPNLGNLNFDDLSITVADIPGLIKGAHENRGLGHAFLRHIERTKVLAYVVDLAAALNGRKGIPPWEQLRDLVFELENHQEGLSDRPSLIVANKIDEDGATDVYEELKTRVAGVPMFPVCAVLEEGIPELKAGLRMLVDGRISDRLGIDRIVVD